MMEQTAVTDSNVHLDNVPAVIFSADLSSVFRLQATIQGLVMVDADFSATVQRSLHMRTVSS